MVVVLQDLGFFALAIFSFWCGVLVTRRLGKKVGYSLAPLGFSKPRGGYLGGVALGLLVGLGGLAANLLIAPLTAGVLEDLGYSAERTVQGTLIRELTGWVEESPGLAVPAILSVVVLFGPAVEELVFRGAIYGGLYRLVLFAASRNGSPGRGERRGKAWEKGSFALSALLSSGTFALVHRDPVILPVLFVLAISLCGLYRRTKSLLPCVVAHAAFNSFAACLMILSGLGVLPVAAP